MGLFPPFSRNGRDDVKINFANMHKKKKKIIILFTFILLLLVVTGFFGQIKYIKYGTQPGIMNIHGSDLYKPSINILTYGPLAKSYVENNDNYIYTCGHPCPMEHTSYQDKKYYLIPLRDFFPCGSATKLAFNKVFVGGDYKKVTNYHWSNCQSALSLFWRSLVYWVVISLILTAILSMLIKKEEIINPKILPN